MRIIKDVLRLTFASGLSQREVARSLKISNGAVAKYLRAAREAGLSWPIPEDLDETALERLLAAKRVTTETRRQQAAPDFQSIHQQLKRKGVTRLLLWEEYRAAHPKDGYGYTQFCTLYHEWKAHLKVTMRQTHLAGEKLFIDYCGPTVPVVDPNTGQAREAQIFVAVLGASNYTYVEATWTQALPDWISSHVRAFSFFGGAAQLLVPDNLKSAVTRACRYEPLINSTYQEMAAHYGSAVLPARPYKPRDKAKVENGVLLVERWILARLRHQTFFSLSNLNNAIRELNTALNDHPFKRLDGSRRSQFLQLDKPALKPLPINPYQFAEWKKARVNIDYHIEVDHHYYSVPFAWNRRELDVRLTASTVECFLRGNRLAAHPRSYHRGYTTVPEHMPRSHRAQLEWTPSRFINWAASVGERTKALVELTLSNRPHPEMGYRSCLGLLSLAKLYGRSRLEAACSRALALGAPSRKTVLSILKTGLDQQPFLQDQQPLFAVLQGDPASDTTPSETAPGHLHQNVRGAAYYQ